MKKVTVFLSGIFFLCLSFSSCTKTVYTTQQGQNWSEYKSVKNGNGKVIDKTKRPKTRRRKLKD